MGYRGRRRLRHVVLAAIAATSMSAVAAVSAAQAVTTKYTPAKESRVFRNSPGGWHGSLKHGGACVPGLTCPTITNGYVHTGGATGPGDGHLQTKIGTLLGVGAVSTGTWRSPVFQYEGAGGSTPDRLEFDMSRKANVGAFLSVAGNTATYSVALQKVQGDRVNRSIELIRPTTLAGADDWTSVESAHVNPGQLKIGSHYRLEITSEFSNGAEVVKGGSTAYDNVVLSASAKPGGSGGPGGHHGHGGHHGGTISIVVLKKIIRVAFPHSVTVHEHNGKPQTVRARVRCRRQAPGKCLFQRLRVVSRGHVVTKPRKAAVRSGHRRTLGMKVRHGGARRLRDGGRVLLKGKLRVGGRTRHISRRVKVHVR